LELVLVDGRLAVTLAPFGPDTTGDLAVQLSPEFGVTGAQPIAVLVERWLVPGAASLLLRRFRDLLARPIWQDGPSAHDVLVTARLIDADDRLQVPLPPPTNLVLSALSALAAGRSLKLSDQLALSLGRTD